MSTGRRLAKRSIIGTRVCAPGPDGLWYSGVIQDVKTPPTQLGAPSENNNCINLTPDTKYSVRFDFKTAQQQQQQQAMDTANTVAMDTTTSAATAAAAAATTNVRQRTNQLFSPAQSVRRNAMIKEFRESELIGPGFRSINGVQLHTGQRVFLTHNGRESSADVISHDMLKDEVCVKIAGIGSEQPTELKIRLEDVRLLESRRSARLAYQDRDTDFARLADMAGDRRRTSHSIDVPLSIMPQHNSRKRRPSYSQDDRENYLQFRDDDQMNECNAALVLMSLSCSPRSPGAGQWNTILGSSPGSSSASCSSGSSSPPLSDDGQLNLIIINDGSARIRTTSLSTSDEGIVMDYSDEAPRKKRAQGPRFKCTWKGCGITEMTHDKIERHVRNTHLGPKKPRHDDNSSSSDHEEDFYYTDIEDDEDEGKAPSPPSPPTLSHRDMARPPHEDPEYQRRLVGNFRQGLLAQSQTANIIKNPPQSQSSSNNSSNNVVPTSPLAHHNYTWPAPPPTPTPSSAANAAAPVTPNPTATATATISAQQHSPVSPTKHPRWSPRPSTSSAPYPSPTYVHHHHHNYSSSTIHLPNNPQLTVTPNNPASNHHQHQPNHNNHQQQHHHQMAHSAPTTTLTPVSPNANNNNLHHIHQIHHASSSHTTTTHHHHSQHHHTHLQSAVAAINRSPQSPNRRTRGENKKCRKVYGMDHKDQWCTQCKWKKACSRFGD